MIILEKTEFVRMKDECAVCNRCIFFFIKVVHVVQGRRNRGARGARAPPNFFKGLKVPFL
jgi:hypothetical protein